MRVQFFHRGRKRVNYKFTSINRIHSTLQLERLFDFLLGQSIIIRLSIKFTRKKDLRKRNLVIN